MQAIALEQHLRTKALEIVTTFIVGLELKDKNGREIWDWTTESQICCQAPGRRGAYFLEA